MSTVRKTKNGPVVFIEFPTEIKSPICGKFFPCRLLLKRNSVNYFFQVGKLGSDNFYADSKKPIKHFLRHCKFVLKKNTTPVTNCSGNCIRLCMENYWFWNKSENSVFDKGVE